jgi:hypothetical protein
VKIQILALVSLLWVSSAQAEVYRWVDEKGQVHFSDQVPEQGQAEALDLPESEKQAPTQSDAAFAEEQRLRQQRVTQVLEEERLAKEKAKAEKQAKIEERKKQCAKFSTRLSYYQPGTQFYEENEDGTRTYMSGEESDKYLEELKKKYEENCTDD